MLSDKSHVLEYLLSFNLLLAESDVTKLDLLVIKLFVYLISIMQRSPTRVFFKLVWYVQGCKLWCFEIFSLNLKKLG